MQKGTTSVSGTNEEGLITNLIFFHIGSKELIRLMGSEVGDLRTVPTFATTDKFYAS